MTHTRAVQLLADQLGLDVEHVTRAFRVTARTTEAMRVSQHSQLTDDQFKRLLGRDRFPVVLVANLAMRFAGRVEDAHLLMDIYKVSEGLSAHRLHLRHGVGTLPKYHDHSVVQQAICILQAAGLPPLETDGIHVIRDGFRVAPAGSHLPGWAFIEADPDCEVRAGFAGGRGGYAAVMRWAGWGVIPVTVGDGLTAVCHPDHLSQFLDS